MGEGRNALGAIRTEEWNTRRVGEMQGLTVFTKVLGARHEFAHLFKYRHRAATDLGPCPI